MPDLLQSLQGCDLGHLRIIAQFWGIELTAPETGAALKQLVGAMCNPSLAAEIMGALPREARLAIGTLAAENGLMPRVAFIRRFGEIRAMGPGRRDRESPHQNPVSAAEILFYHGLLAQAFFDTPKGSQEFIYIPEDLLPLIHPAEQTQAAPETRAPIPQNPEILGRPATPKERLCILPAHDRILDDACTLLAALRLGWKEPPFTENWYCPPPVLANLLSAAGLISGSSLQPERVKAFLEMPRRAAMDALIRLWKESRDFNELRQVPGLVCEGEWRNPVLDTRNSVLGFLAPLPKGQWWSLPAFVWAVKEKHPDFQRPTGDYDSWFIRCVSDNSFLHGFAHWEDVEGALIRYFITGPLYWLGMVDLASPDDETAPASFRRMDPGSRIHAAENGRLHVASRGQVSVPRRLPRAARYQIARFCDWEPPLKDEYRYRITPASLARARQQRLKPEQLLAVLQKYAAAPIPPPFVRAIQRWQINGTEARVEFQTVLRVSRPEVLEELRKSRGGRFLGEILGPVTAAIKPGAQSKILAALAEMGLLAEDKTNGDIIAGEINPT